MKKYRLFFSVAAILLLFGFFGFRVEAQEILTTLANQYKAASAGWMTASLGYARHLFFLLATIEIAVTSIYLLFQKDGAAEFFASLTIKLLSHPITHNSVSY